MDGINNETFFVEVILPLSLRINYTYRVPVALNQNIEIGKRVLVQFGKKRIYTALVYKLSTQPPLHYEAKYILDVVDELPIVTADQIKFWEWIAQYYMCNLGDVLIAALPSAMKWSSDSVLCLSYEEEDISNLSEGAQIVYIALTQKKQLSITEIMHVLQQKNVQKVINELIGFNLAHLTEEITDKFKPLRKTFYQLDFKYKDAKLRENLFQSLEKAPKQLDVLLYFSQLAAQGGELSREDLLQSPLVSAAAINALVEKGILQRKQKVVDRLKSLSADFDSNFTLSVAQQKAKYEIEDAWLNNHQVVLLYGVTSAGKTQVYIKLIEDLLNKKPSAQVLFLLPEIALTTQLVERVKNYFNDKIGVYHSKFSDQERVEIWNKVLRGEYQVVLGARSALFLSFQNLQLLIVDEEHESSYKQHDPAPRYQARDAAIVLARSKNAKVILGSATPSAESWNHAQNGKYGLVKLTERFGGVALPHIELVDIKTAVRNKKTNAYFSQNLVEEITQKLAQGEQVILFQNRRGFAPLIFCKTCGFTPKCVDCDVSLTFHKNTGKLHCHYCGFNTTLLHTCPACGALHLQQKGTGTEKIEEDLQFLFPQAIIARLDLDSTRKKNSLQHILQDFKSGKIQILVGTQMVAKGLDFDNVTFIGIMDADNLLNYPDFRADERAYQLMAQVAGRAGRRNKQGKVLIQTFKPEHPIFKWLINNDYESMIHNQVQIRKNFNYPPECRLIAVRFKHKDESVVNSAALYFAKILYQQLNNRVFGPEIPLVSRVKNMYLRNILLKVELKASTQKIKNYLEECLVFFQSKKEYKNVIIQFDIDV